MNIQFLEHDGLLQDDGLPKIVVVSVDGVKFPYETSKTIVELFKDAERVKKAPAVLQRDSLQRPVDSQAGDTIEHNKSSSMQRNDTVKYLGVLKDGVRMSAQDNPDLIMGELYKVIEVKKDIVTICKPDSDFPIRLNIAKTDLVIVEKGERVTQKKQEYEIIKSCTQCGETNALTLRGDEYIGECLKCHIVIKEKK